MYMPVGRPALSSACAQNMASNGVSMAGLSTTAQPASKAPADFMMVMANGPFQGAICATTPIGSCRTIERHMPSRRSLVTAEAARSTWRRTTPMQLRAAKRR